MILNTSIVVLPEHLVGLVKACQKHNVKGKSGTWAEFIKVHKQGGHTDPKRQKKEVLEAFVADLLADGGADGGAASARDFIQHYLKWAEKVRKDAAKGRGVLPPPAHPSELAVTGGGARQQKPPQPKEQQPQQPEQAHPPTETEAQQQQQQQQQPPPQQPPPQQPPPQQPLEVPPHQVSVWSMVRRTRAHPKYNTLYGNLPSYTAGWVRVKRPLLSAAVRPRLLALDCEMCATEGDSSSLLGVCVVDEFGEVVYRQLVRPTGQVVDLRTALTGVTATDLEGVTATAKDAQRAVRKLLEGGAAAAGEAGAAEGAQGGRPVVLVGHSLHHDLAALKLDYEPVIDTALMHSFKGLPACIPGLKDLAKALLGLEMRRTAGGVHDSREDAAVAMRLVMRELQLASPPGPLEPPDYKVPAEDLAKLLVHSLPLTLKQQGDGETALRAAFAAAGAPAFERADPNPGDANQLLLVFRNAAVANEAFAKLPGEPGKDALGRYFKSVALGSGTGSATGTRTGLMCKVRKMACHNGMAFGNVSGHGAGGGDGDGGGGGSPAAKRGGPTKRGTKRARSEDPTGSAGASRKQAGTTGGNPGGGGAAAATPTTAANGSARKAKRQKKGAGASGGAGAGGGGGGSGRDPLRDAAKRPRRDSAAAAAAAAAAAVAGVSGAGAAVGPIAVAVKAAEDPSAAGQEAKQEDAPRKKRRKQQRDGAAVASGAAPAPAGQAGAAAGGAGAGGETAPGGHREGSSKREERKRKREREAEAAVGAPPGAVPEGDGGGAGSSPGGEKERKRARKRAG